MKETLKTLLKDLSPILIRIIVSALAAGLTIHVGTHTISLKLDEYTAAVKENTARLAGVVEIGRAHV